MADEKEPQAPEGMTSTGVGASDNRTINETPEQVGQTPEQFYGGEGAERPDQAEAPRGHATKGMTQLGYSEASRIEDTAEAQEKDRKLAERLAAKEDR